MISDETYRCAVLLACGAVSAIFGLQGAAVVIPSLAIVAVAAVLRSWRTP